MKRTKILQNSTDTKKQKGASLVEYALLVALIAVALIVVLRSTSSAISQKFSQVNSGLATS